MFKYLYYIKAHTHTHTRRRTQIYVMCKYANLLFAHHSSHTYTHTQIQTTVSACTPPLGCPPGWFVAHSFHAFHRWLQTKLQLNKQTKQEQIRACNVWLLPLPHLPSHPWLSSSAWLVPPSPPPHDHIVCQISQAMTSFECMRFYASLLWFDFMAKF